MTWRVSRAASPGRRKRCRRRRIPPSLMQANHACSWPAPSGPWTRPTAGSSISASWESAAAARSRTSSASPRAHWPAGRAQPSPSSAPSSREEPPNATEPEVEAPAPSSKARSGHSGRLMLRMPQSLHAELAKAAEREDVSLNQFITNTLAAGRDPDEHRRGGHRRRDRSGPAGGGPPAGPVAGRSLRRPALRGASAEVGRRIGEPRGQPQAGCAGDHQQQQRARRTEQSATAFVLVDFMQDGQSTGQVAGGEPLFGTVATRWTVAFLAPALAGGGFLRLRAGPPPRR